MKTVRDHLEPGGMFAMYNYYEPFLLDRYAGTLEQVYGTAPCVELGDSLGGAQQAVLVAGAGASDACETPWDGERVSARRPTTTRSRTSRRARSRPSTGRRCC